MISLASKWTRPWPTLILLSWLLAQTSFGNDSELLAVRNARPGDVVSVPRLWSQQRSMPLIPIEISAEKSVQFLLSDEPEYFRQDGISLREKVKPGVVRLYVYHVPEPSGASKIITAMIENNSAKPMQMRFLRYAFPKPGRNYLHIGKRGLVEFFNSVREKTSRSIEPGEQATIDPQMDQALVGKDELVHGFYEFEIDQPATVYVLQREPSQSNSDAIRLLPLLKTVDQRASGAGRGLFLTNNFSVKTVRPIETTNGAVKLIIADGKRDSWIHGTDSIDGQTNQLNKGNYGTIYRIRLNWHSGDGRGLAMFVANQSSGGLCAGQALALKVSAGDFPGGVVQLPRDQTGYSGGSNMVLVQRFPAPPKNEIGQIEIVYSPPGASCLPTPLIFVPYEAGAK